MPRNGTQSDNVVDTSAGNQVHGVGEDSSIDRSGKVRKIEDPNKHVSAAY
jgi:hypothetical protein